MSNASREANINANRQANQSAGPAPVPAFLGGIHDEPQLPKEYEKCDVDCGPECCMGCLCPCLQILNNWKDLGMTTRVSASY